MTDVSEPPREATTLRSKAYHSFTERLLARDILPGQFVTQRELVAITGMPLGAIRELVPRLEAEGIVKTVPQRGMQIAHVDIDLIRNAFQLRLILEREALAEFCRKADSATIDRIRDEHLEIAEEAGQEITPHLIDRAQAIDWGFHDLIIDHLGNELVSNVYRVNSIKIRIIRGRETRILPELIHNVVAEHMHILDALAER
ncbi:MAG: GntR family transcriptional regulator, partial [Chelatococcus sp.]|uniref:GntR family transcriptional regulator n=1 Tax=Chelatococcus sp. TaxID=1953771 RepID=UPI002623846D